MRLLQIAVPDERRDALLDELSDSGIGYLVTDAAPPQDGLTIVQFAVPADAVEHVLDDLTDAGFDREQWTVSIAAEFAEYEGIEDVEDRWSKTPNRIAPTTLRSKAKAIGRNTRSYLWMMVLSAVVATAGLLLSSPAIVVGSMVIAPIVGPMLTASVGAVRGDREMVVESVHQQGYGLAVAMVTATAFAYVAKRLAVVPAQIAVGQMDLLSIRLSPSTLALVVGLSAGAAGAYGLATSGRVTIVGVMIAAALIPTAAAVGIGVAWGEFVVALGALLLLLVTVVAVNLGATGMLVYLRYRPDEAKSGEDLLSWPGPKRGAVLAATALATLLLVASVGAGFVNHSSLEREVNAAISDALSSEEYDDLRVERTTIEYDAPDRVGDRTVVTVALSRTDGGSYPNVADELARRIEQRTGEEVVVKVRFVDYQRGTVDGAQANASSSGASEASVRPVRSSQSAAGT